MVCWRATTLLWKVVKHLLCNPLEKNDYSAPAGRREKIILCHFCHIMCLLMLALMKQLIMIRSNNCNLFKKDKWNCFCCWMLFVPLEHRLLMRVQRELLMGVLILDGIIFVIAAFWFVMPESCLIHVYKEIHVLEKNTGILFVVNHLLNFVNSFSDCQHDIPFLSQWKAELQAECSTRAWAMRGCRAPSTLGCQAVLSSSEILLLYLCLCGIFT